MIRSWQTAYEVRLAWLESFGDERLEQQERDWDRDDAEARDERYADDAGWWDA